MQDYMFSDGQDLSTLDSTGVVSTNVFDQEVDGATNANTILTDDQIDAFFNVLILATTNTGGDEGLRVQLRCDDDAALNFGVADQPADGTANEQIVGEIFIKQDDIVAGKKFSTRVKRANLGKYLGAWFKAASTSLNGATTVDCWCGDAPVGENEDIQKTTVQH